MLKHWVETRFGLLTRHHAGPLGDNNSEARHAYLRQASAGIYATNAIEAQLDNRTRPCNLANLMPRFRER